MYIPTLLLAVIIVAAFCLGVFLTAFAAASRQRGVIEKLLKLRTKIHDLGGKVGDMYFDEGD